MVMRTRLCVTFIRTLRLLLCFNLIYRVNLQISYFLLLYLCRECGGVAPNVDSKRHIQSLAGTQIAMLCPVEASCSTKLDRVVIGAVRNGYRSLCTDRLAWERVQPFHPTKRYFLVFLEGFLMRCWCVVSELFFL